MRALVLKAVLALLGSTSALAQPFTIGGVTPMVTTTEDLALLVQNPQALQEGRNEVHLTAIGRNATVFIKKHLVYEVNVPLAVDDPMLPELVNRHGELTAPNHYSEGELCPGEKPGAFSRHSRTFRLAQWPQREGIMAGIEWRAMTCREKFKPYYVSMHLEIAFAQKALGCQEKIRRPETAAFCDR